MLKKNTGVHKELKEASEFYNPELGLDINTYIEKEIQQGVHHLGRYHWAKQVLGDLAPKRILDIACGSGYGSYIIANHMKDAIVVGAEYDARGVELAKNTYSRENLSYVNGNIVTWEDNSSDEAKPLGLFDVVVSFDTIEHLLHREIALIRITENLSEDGVLLLSTPCGHNLTRLNPGWEHHKIEYSHLDLQNFLRRFFKAVMIPEEDDFPGIEYWNTVINKDKNRYLNKTNPVYCKDPIKY